MEIGTSISELLLGRLRDEVPEWMERGACVDSGLDPFALRDFTELRRLCAKCPVVEQCGEYGETSGMQSGLLASRNLLEG